ncbi:MAG: 2-phospho-L-lactate guanylyltransferase [Propionibacteriales bacterium]|nr:2-phospho-L-lactate guanylyltransferase [Propionibacteriales bacterium]
MVVPPGGFVILLPVKSPGTGKTRMTSLTDADRGRLARAFAVDALDACLATPGVVEVVVISDDAGFAAVLADRGARTCPDPELGLNAALRHGAAMIRDDRPDLRPVALLADLPALSPVDLAAALDFAGASSGACFVQDADGTGTTLYTAPYDAFEPRFGPDSAQRHSAHALAVPGPLTTLRRDVDDLDGLRAALALGVGSATTAAAAAVAPTT